jgi:hypothetical protein
VRGADIPERRGEVALLPVHLSALEERDHRVRLQCERATERFHREDRLAGGGRGFAGREETSILAVAGGHRVGDGRGRPGQ